jgi:hypothetical protein
LLESHDPITVIVAELGRPRAENFRPGIAPAQSKSGAPLAHRDTHARDAILEHGARAGHPRTGYCAHHNVRARIRARNPTIRYHQCALACPSGLRAGNRPSTGRLRLALCIQTVHTEHSSTFMHVSYILDHLRVDIRCVEPTLTRTRQPITSTWRATSRHWTLALATGSIRARAVHVVHPIDSRSGAVSLRRHQGRDRSSHAWRSPAIEPAPGVGAEVLSADRQCGAYEPRWRVRGYRLGTGQGRRSRAPCGPRKSARGDRGGRLSAGLPISRPKNTDRLSFNTAVISIGARNA